MSKLIDKLYVDKEASAFVEKLIVYGDLLTRNLDVYEVEITNGEADIYKGDFSKICTKVLEMDLMYLPLLLKINGYNSSVEYDGKTKIKTFTLGSIKNAFSDNLK